MHATGARADAGATTRVDGQNQMETVDKADAERAQGGVDGCVICKLETSSPTGERVEDVRSTHEQSST